MPTETLRQEHREIRELLQAYASLPADDPLRRERLFDELHRRLLLHFALEEEVVYPAVRKLGVERALELVEEAEWGHRRLRQLLSELSQRSANDRSFDSKIGVLRLNLEHYADLEERTLFAELHGMSPERRESLRVELERTRGRLLDRESSG
jgi:hemerythrin superfamily protein